MTDASDSTAVHTSRRTLLALFGASLAAAPLLLGLDWMDMAAQLLVPTSPG